MSMDYPAPDPKFEAQAIDLMMRKQDQLNQTVEQAPVVETPEPKAKAPARKKSAAKKGSSIKKEEVIETPVEEVERKPYYLQAEILAGGRVVGFFKAYKDRSGLELEVRKSSMRYELKALKGGAAAIFEDGLGSPVLDIINPNEEPWRFISSIDKLFLGAPFSGGEVTEIEYEQ